MGGGSGIPEPPADTTGPTVNIDVGTVTDTSIQVKATATDESGLEETDTYRFLLNEEEKGKNTTGEYTFEGLTSETKYTIKVEVKDKLGNLGSATKEVITNTSTISPSTSYVGYYADVNGDEIMDGIIYADLAFTKSGQWGSTPYSYNAITNLKDYYISSDTDYAGVFGAKPVISRIDESDGEDRFYVMALSDIDSEAHKWWYLSNKFVSTSTDFGTGRENTAAVRKIDPTAFRKYFLPSIRRMVRSI